MDLYSNLANYQTSRWREGKWVTFPHQGRHWGTVQTYESSGHVEQQIAVQVMWSTQKRFMWRVFTLRSSDFLPPDRTWNLETWDMGMTNLLHLLHEINHVQRPENPMFKRTKWLKIRRSFWLQILNRLKTIWFFSPLHHHTLRAASGRTAQFKTMDLNAHGENTWVGHPGSSRVIQGPGLWYPAW